MNTEGALIIKDYGMTTKRSLEVCVETLAAAQAAAAGGADRIELCEHLSVDGLTPSEDLTRAVMQSTSIPITLLIRPRAGNFIYSPAYIDQMACEIQFAKQVGVMGVTLGLLNEERKVDVVACRELVQLARPMEVTFHRAFDVVADQLEALEDVIATGADRILTSGGASNVLEGAEMIAQLVERAGTRIEIMAGGGLRLENLLEVRRLTDVQCVHGSLTRRPQTNLHDEGNLKKLAPLPLMVEDVREAVRLMQLELATV